MSQNVTEPVRTPFERGTLPRLTALARRIRIYLLIDGVAVVSPAILAAILITLGLDRALRLDVSMRLAQGLAALAMIAWLIRRYLLNPVGAALSRIDLAALVERRYPQLSGRLVIATEFALSPTDPPRGSSAFIDEIVRQADREASRLSFTAMLNHRRAARQAFFGFSGLAGIALLLLLAPTTMGLWFERNVMLRSVEWPSRNHLIVEGLVNGKILVPREDDAAVSVAVAPGYETPRQTYIRYRGLGGSSGEAQMAEVRGRPVRFTHTFERLAESLTCRVVGGDAQTEPFVIEVIERPAITGARIGIAPPAYTRLAPYELRDGQTVAEVLIGSEIRLNINTDQPVVSAVLIRDIGGAPVAVGSAERLDDREFRSVDRPPATASYHFELTSAAGLSNIGPRVPPTRFTIRLDRDQAPSVKMRIQGAGEMITPQAVLPIDTEFSDAYGLAAASIVFSSAKSGDKPVAEPLPGFEPASKSFIRSIDWLAADHGLQEGDRLSLWAEAADFDDVSGPNVGKSQPVVFRIVSREELAAELNRRQHGYRQDFERYVRRQEDLYSEILSAAQPPAVQADRRERTQQLRQLARRQRDQAGQITVAARQFEQVLSEMRINALSTPAVEERLGRGVAQPLRDVGRVRMPVAAELIERLADDEDATGAQRAREAQAALREEMNNILTRMLEWERLEEAVILLRDVLNMQRSVGKETDTTLERDILGTAPASEPAK